MERNCLYCGKKFLAPIREINRGNGKYCSRACSGARKKGQIFAPTVILICSNPCCQKEFEIKESVLRSKESQNKTSYHFCCRACKDEAQKLSSSLVEMQPDHYGTANGKNTYRRMAMDHYGAVCAKCGYRKSLAALEVHHRDSNRENNDLENLIVLCANCHAEQHFEEGTGKWAQKN